MEVPDVLDSCVHACSIGEVACSVPCKAKHACGQMLTPYRPCVHALSAGEGYSKPWVSGHGRVTGTHKKGRGEGERREQVGGGHGSEGPEGNLLHTCRIMPEIPHLE